MCAIADIARVKSPQIEWGMIIPPETRRDSSVNICIPFITGPMVMVTGRLMSCFQFDTIYNGILRHDKPPIIQGIQALHDFRIF